MCIRDRDKGMGVDMKVKAIYDSEIGNITRSEKSWKDVLKLGKV